MLSPDEIQAREFLVSLRGYDRDEVHSFLGEVADQVRDLEARLRGWEAGVPASPPAAVRAEPAGAVQPADADTASFFSDLGKTTQRILEAAHQAGSEIQRTARIDADRELAEARAHAAMIVAEAEHRREAIEEAVLEIEERRAALADDLRGVAQAVERALCDLAPREELPASEPLLAAASIAVSGEPWNAASDAVEEADELATSASLISADTGECVVASSDADELEALAQASEPIAPPAPPVPPATLKVAAKVARSARVPTNGTPLLPAPPASPPRVAHLR